ncbi:hypothetical protein BJ085DRAFT_41573 [Dimargaris cristalligena]|uniref:RING-type domain-containing protein n=1 Tax=Dimargaris cristalligena TaxID=215637 RepID=A0A4P9ZJR4_9FUNG|nr:hypothetical protein BJ085DRAFT_41573 [Dimargaris cristalligena]|eukprot:RKP33305.1 hypothetical protein BJ085DRAFT_41573 [Dimargaris cristalligena]
MISYRRVHPLLGVMNRYNINQPILMDDRGRDGHYAPFLNLRLVLLDKDGQPVDFSVMPTSKKRAIIAGSVIGSIAFVVFLLITYFAYRRYQYSRLLAMRRSRGIEMLETGLKQGAPGPLDPLLLEYLPVISTPKRALSSLKRATPQVSSNDGEEQVDEDLDLGERRAARAPQFGLAAAVASLRSGIRPLMGESHCHSSGNRSKSGGPSSGSESRGEHCAICQESIRGGQKIRQLPCRHDFHVACIDQWLTKKSSVCPLCDNHF